MRKVERVIADLERWLRKGSGPTTKTTPFLEYKPGDVISSDDMNAVRRAVNKLEAAIHEPESKEIFFRIGGLSVSFGIAIRRKEALADA